MQGQRGRGLVAYGGIRKGLRGRRGRGFNHHSAEFGNDFRISAENRQLALQMAESNQCNNLSFETNDPATKHSRIYVGNIAKKRVSRSDLYVIFSRYGIITAISHLTSKAPTDDCYFGFIQFTTSTSAIRAVQGEHGQGYHGYNFEVKLAEFKNQDSQKLKLRTQPRNNNLGASKSREQLVGMKFNKRPSGDSQDLSAPEAKRSKLGSDGPLDILVCGSCHVSFTDLKAMILHKNTPCAPVKKCHCNEEGIPDIITCAVCMKPLSSPWKLIQHMQIIHSIKICNSQPTTGAQVGIKVECTDVLESNDAMEDEGTGDDGPVDLDNDLLDEEEEQTV